jgi:hypothetical protein
MSAEESARAEREKDSWANYREWVATMLNVFLAPDGLVATDRTIDEFAQLLECRAKELAVAAESREQALVAALVAAKQRCAASHGRMFDCYNCAQLDAALAASSPAQAKPEIPVPEGMQRCRACAGRTVDCRTCDNTRFVRKPQETPGADVRRGTEEAPRQTRTRTEEQFGGVLPDRGESR